MRLNPFKTVLSRGEPMLARVPVLGSLVGAQTDEHKALVAKQKQLGEEAAIRERQNHQARLNAMAQQMGALDPFNQLVQQKTGRGFQPEQLANMIKDPYQRPQMPPELINYTGTDPRKRAQIQDIARRQREYDQAEAARREQVMGSLSPLPQGPAPLQLPPPQAARRY